MLHQFVLELEIFRKSFISQVPSIMVIFKCSLRARFAVISSFFVGDGRFRLNSRFNLCILKMFFRKVKMNAAVSGDKLSFEGITQFYIVFSVMARFFTFGLDFS